MLGVLIAGAPTRHCISARRGLCAVCEEGIYETECICLYECVCVCVCVCVYERMCACASEREVVQPQSTLMLGITNARKEDRQ